VFFSAAVFSGGGRRGAPEPGIQYRRDFLRNRIPGPPLRHVPE
jgi:hypothetical protein